ncbi:hypothetical protein ACT7C7_29815 [Bacillus cereus]
MSAIQFPQLPEMKHWFFTFTLNQYGSIVQQMKTALQSAFEQLEKTKSYS